jgi:hypothetical protein
VVFEYKVLHGFSTIIIGLFFIYLISVFYISSYFHGTLCKYFLPNLYRIKYALAFSVLRFSLFPCIYAAVHVFMY